MQLSERIGAASKPLHQQSDRFPSSHVSRLSLILLERSQQMPEVHKLSAFSEASGICFSVKASYGTITSATFLRVKMCF